MRNLASHFAVLLTGIAIGLGSVAVAQSQTARPASDAQIVRAIGTSNYSGLRGALMTTIGTSDSLGLRRTVDKNGDDTRRTLASVCRALAEKSYECPLP